MDLRCDNKKWGEIIIDSFGILEVSCRSRFKGCEWEPGTVVLHKFNLTNGELMSTSKYREPERVKE